MSNVIRKAVIAISIASLITICLNRILSFWFLEILGDWIDKEVEKWKQRFS